jgi:hypothetical protein
VKVLHLLLFTAIWAILLAVVSVAGLWRRVRAEAEIRGDFLDMFSIPPWWWALLLGPPLLLIVVGLWQRARGG